MREKTHRGWKVNDCILKKKNAFWPSLVGTMSLLLWLLLLLFVVMVVLLFLLPLLRHPLKLLIIFETLGKAPLVGRSSLFNSSPL